MGPLNEKNGLQLARSIGPYLVTLLSSSSKNLIEASAIALGNLALSGFRVAKVLVNQESINSLLKSIQNTGMHINLGMSLSYTQSLWQI